MDWIRAFRDDSQAVLPALSEDAVPVLLIGSAPLLVNGMAQALSVGSEFSVCGEADDAESALEAVDRLQPAIALVSLAPDDDSLSLVPRLCALDLSLRVLVLAHIEQPTAAERAIRDGARGYALATLSPARLLDTLRSIASGDVVLPDDVVDRMLMRLVRQHPGGHPSSGVGLSEREVQVLELMGNGLSRTQIAERIHLSVKTIDVYRQKLRSKLLLGSMTELYNYAAGTRSPAGQWSRQA